jgi:hypothetical protein
MRKTVLLLAIGAVLGLPAAQQDRYLDIMTVKVKTDKRADFEAITKRIAEANRNHNGDQWLAVDTAYGELNTVSFISPRADLAAVERGMGAFMSAVNKSLGAAGADKLFRQFGETAGEMRAEIRLRRWDLSSSVPSDAAGYAKLVGATRWIGTTTVRIKPGRALDYEEQLRAIKKAAEAGENPMTILVSQSVAGGGTAYYLSILTPAFGDFEKIVPLRKLLGEDAFLKYVRVVSDVSTAVETAVYRVLPELSVLPREVTDVAPDFWKPKPAARPAK